MVCSMSGDTTCRPSISSMIVFPTYILLYYYNNMLSIYYYNYYLFIYFPIELLFIVSCSYDMLSKREGEGEGIVNRESRKKIDFTQMTLKLLLPRPPLANSPNFSKLPLDKFPDI